MKRLLICGSVRRQSTTHSLLRYIKASDQSALCELAVSLDSLPLYHPDHDQTDCPVIVKQWRDQVAAAASVIIATPEYIYGIPAVLKNALEWLTKSGSLQDKKTIAICYTPHEPRGEKAMASLVNVLTALDARVLTSLMLYHTDIAFDVDGGTDNSELPELLQESISLFS